MLRGISATIFPRPDNENYGLDGLQIHLSLQAVGFRGSQYGSFFFSFLLLVGYSFIPLHVRHRSSAAVTPKAPPPLLLR
jgi:hypothetical protein